MEQLTDRQPSSVVMWVRSLLAVPLRCDLGPSGPDSRMAWLVKKLAGYSPNLSIGLFLQYRSDITNLPYHCPIIWHKYAIFCATVTMILVYITAPARQTGHRWGCHCVSVSHANLNRHSRRTGDRATTLKASLRCPNNSDGLLKA